MNFDEWFDHYRPVVNETGDSGLVVDDKCYFFETHKPDVTRVLEANARDPRTVWTVVDGDDDKVYLVNGYQLVNRQGYLISEVPFEGDHLAIDFLD